MTTLRAWALALCLTVLPSAALAAQSVELPPALTPMTKLRWGDGPGRLDEVMEDLGFSFWEQPSGDSGRFYAGRLLGHEAYIIALMKEGGLGIVTVELEAEDPLVADQPGRELLATYRLVVNLLSARYGLPDVAVERYEPDSGLAGGIESSALDTAEAIEDGRSDLIRAWGHGSMVLGARIIDGPTIAVTYEPRSAYGVRNILEKARAEARWTGSGFP